MAATKPNPPKTIDEYQPYAKAHERLRAFKGKAELLTDEISALQDRLRGGNQGAIDAAEKVLAGEDAGSGLRERLNRLMHDHGVITAAIPEAERILNVTRGEAVSAVNNGRIPELITKLKKAVVAAKPFLEAAAEVQAYDDEGQNLGIGSFAWAERCLVAKKAIENWMTLDADVLK